MAIYWPIFLIVIQLIFLEGILSIDNAAIIGALVSPLPDKVDIPWPTPLKALGPFLHPILGNQRMAALRVGLLGAYFGRGLMLFLASFLIHNTWIKLIGAAYLIHLAFDGLEETVLVEEDRNEEEGSPIKLRTFWSTVLTVELMDLVFSIDNVVAAVSLSKLLWVVMLGVAIGILMMRYAAGLFSYAVEHEPILKNAAYILVLVIGFELILEQVWNVNISDLPRFLISVSIILLALAYEHIKPLRKIRFILLWLSQGIGIINELVDWLLAPLRGILSILVNLFRLLQKNRA